MTTMNPGWPPVEQGPVEMSPDRSPGPEAPGGQPVPRVRPYVLDPAEFRAWRLQRRGLGPQDSDPAALRRVAELLRGVGSA